MSQQFAILDLDDVAHFVGREGEQCPRRSMVSSTTTTCSRAPPTTGPIPSLSPRSNSGTTAPRKLNTPPAHAEAPGAGVERRGCDELAHLLGGHEVATLRQQEGQVRALGLCDRHGVPPGSARSSRPRPRRRRSQAHRRSRRPDGPEAEWREPASSSPHGLLRHGSLTKPAGRPASGSSTLRRSRIRPTRPSPRTVAPT